MVETQAQACARSGGGEDGALGVDARWILTNDTTGFLRLVDGACILGIRTRECERGYNGASAVALKTELGEAEETRRRIHEQD